MVLQLEQALQVQLALAHVLVVHVQQAGGTHVQAALLQHPGLVSHVVQVHFLAVSGRFDFHQVKRAIFPAAQNVGHAVVAVKIKGRLTNSRLPRCQQLLRALLGLGKALRVLRVERHLHKATEVAHGQVAHGVTVVQHRLVHDAGVVPLAQMLLHPQHFGALHAAGVFRLGEIHGIPRLAWFVVFAFYCTAAAWQNARFSVPW